MKRCKDNHPTVSKLNKIQDLAVSLGIHLEFIGDCCIVTDTRYPGRMYRLEDLENASGVTEFPASFETKLTFEE